MPKFGPSVVVVVVVVFVVVVFFVVVVVALLAADLEYRPDLSASSKIFFITYSVRQRLASQ